MVKRINIAFPEETIKELNRIVPSGSRSRLVVAAVDEKLDELKREEATKEFEKARNKHTSFGFIKSKEDAIAWVKKLRKESNRLENY